MFSQSSSSDLKMLVLPEVEVMNISSHYCICQHFIPLLYMAKVMLYRVYCINCVLFNAVFQLVLYTVLHHFSMQFSFLLILKQMPEQSNVYYGIFLPFNQISFS